MGSLANSGAQVGVEQDDLVIPLIDFAQFLNGNPETRKTIASQILHAFKTSGFLYLKNHGIPKSQIDLAFSESASFFQRPQTQKDGLGWTTPDANRGYVASGREKVTQSSDPEEIARLRANNPDLKESLEIGREGVPGLPNQWPDKLDAEGETFTKNMQSFFLTLKSLHIEVMRAIALGMGLDTAFFDTYTSAGDNTLRLLHYPSVSREVFIKNPGQVRAGEHSDYGSVTLLFQDSVGGLEVQSPRGTWVRATPIADTIVINAGDLLARWSNDLIRSTRHRVVQPPEALQNDDRGDGMLSARYSIAYFCNPNFDKYIEALPGTWNEQTNKKKYEGILSGDYLVRRLAATY